jgi:CheY-like chemotaxis protein
MLGLLDIARKNVQEASAQAYLGACKNSGVLMLNLINSILDLSQVKNNKLKLVYTKFQVNSLLREVQSLFDYFCEVKKLYLTVDVMPNVPKYITTDKNRLSQILVNLLGNAFKFTFTGGINMRVELESSDPCRLKFSIQDTGIGISREDQERLFRMYGKLEQKNKKINTNGVGLGLTISNTLAILLNPSDTKPIQIESEVDKGTCFSFLVASQSSDNSSKNDSAASISLAECSSLGFTEDRDTTVLKKMNTYTINSVDNFHKMVTSVPSTERRRLISPTKEDFSIHAPEISARGAHPVIQPSKTEEFLSKKKAVDIQRKGRSQMTIKETMKILKDVNNQIREDDENTEERNWCLVVDDNPFNLMVASHIMQERGYQVKTALNGQEALDAAQQHPLGFDVILMDCQMPVMDGYEATRRLRKLMENGKLQYSPIIALTANNRDDEHEKLCQEVGMSGHVAKPLQIEELEDVLKEVKKNHT